jgi:hypothetical protein
MCFSGSLLPVCLTSMFVMYTGEATKSTPSPCEQRQQPQAEPHDGIAEVVRVPGVAPQAAVEHPPGVTRVGPEPL